jgi:hypothetical protein
MARSRTGYPQKVSNQPRIVLSHDELIAALEARRGWAERYDKANERAHKAEENRVLAEFRARLEEALHWTYAELKEHHWEIEVPYMRRPECPASAVALLDQVLTGLALDRRKTLTVSDSNDMSRVHWLLTFDETAKVEVC